MKILYDNIAMNSTITSFSENPYYEWDTALNDTRLTRYGRTLGVDDEWLMFESASAVDVDWVYISNHNITSGATVKIQGNATDSWGSPSVDQAMSYDSTYDYWYYNFSSTESYKYWRIYIDDPTNTDGYIQIAYVFIGEGLTMPGINPEVSVPYTSNAEVTKTPSGQAYGDRRVRLKGGGVTFPTITETQRQSMLDFFDYVDLTLPFLVLFWENDLDVEPPLYAQLTNSLEITKNNQAGLTWTLTLEFEEVR
ncbi:MAG: hypothetical protein PVF17_01005 [Ignavibacteria bacterium]|jgi:hypothetical protein